MKKVLNHILLFIFIALFFCGIPSFPATAKATESEPQETVFVVESKWIANTDSGVFVFDESDKTLKNLSDDPNSSLAYFVGEIVSMCSLNQSIYLLSAENKIIVFNTETLSTTEIQVDSTVLEEENTSIDANTKISVSLIDEKAILCLFPSSIANGEKLIFGVPNEQTYSFHTLEFTTNEESQNKNISYIKFIRLENQNYCLRVFGNKITSYPCTLSSSEQLATVTALNIMGSNEPDSELPSQNIVCIDTFYQENNSYIVVSQPDTTYVYKFNGTNVSWAGAGSHRFNDIAYECKDMSSNGNSIAILAENSYYLASLSQEGEVTTTKKVSNPEPTISALEHKDFSYYSVSQETEIIYLLGESKSLTIPAQSRVVEVASVTLSGGQPLYGYKYVLYTYHDNLGRHNILGFIKEKNNCLSPIVQHFDNEFVKVYENTKLYKYPSVVVNSNDSNAVLSNISANKPVKVINFIDGYCITFNTIETKFALVEVNGEVGFIDTQNIMSEDKRLILAIPNAKLVSQAKVYELSDTHSGILHTLEKDTKVKLLGSRDQNGLIKIAYNDENGNYFEGYIDASMAKSNSYTTLQIIGTVLVCLNFVFLAILLITKRRITR